MELHLFSIYKRGIHQKLLDNFGGASDWLKSKKRTSDHDSMIRADY